jgi:hypothetical protein
MPTCAQTPAVLKEPPAKPGTPFFAGEHPNALFSHRLSQNRSDWRQVGQKESARYLAVLKQALFANHWNDLCHSRTDN